MGLTGRSGGWRHASIVRVAWLLAACCYATGAMALSPDAGATSADSIAPQAPAAAAPEFPAAMEIESTDARYAFQWVMEVRDNRGLPFAIVDKKSARLFVFDGNGHLRGATPALLGLTPGDAPALDMAKRSVASLGLDERTTPAGRFASEPGHNLQGEAIVWIDYEAKLAIHRLRPAAANEFRPQRLASLTPDDNRISMGCVIVPTAFYDTVVAPLLGRSYGVVYVLPEGRPVQGMLGAFQLGQQ